MKIVRESIILEQKKLALSAGLVVIQDNTILLAHPTGSKWKHTYSIPKGHIESDESILDAALRETKEETGINVNDLIIEDFTENFIDYTDKKGKLYKRVYYYVAYPDRPITEFTPQMDEVDWCGFLTKEEAKSKIFWRFKPLLKYLN